MRRHGGRSRCARGALARGGSSVHELRDVRLCGRGQDRAHDPSVDNDEVMRLSDDAVRAWRGGAAARDLTDECEAVLEGRYAEYLTGRGLHVPVWVWTNLAAHGTERMLRCAAVAGHAAGGQSVWRTARSLVVTEALRAAPAYGGLSGLQSSVLVAHELQLAARHGVELWTPSEWVSSVLSAMHRRTFRPLS